MQLVAVVCHKTNNHIIYRRNVVGENTNNGINALLKLAFLAIQNMEKIWNKTAFNWKSILSELLITFGDRIQIDKLEN